jgi:hypothetical protein
MKRPVVAPLSRREEIEATVAAFDAANPLTPLPRNAARLLAAMFAAGDLYQGSLEAIAALGFGPRHLPRTLPLLAEAGLLVRQPGPAACLTWTSHTTRQRRRETFLIHH